jgi:hypothetical protein
MWRVFAHLEKMAGRRVGPSRWQALARAEMAGGAVRLLSWQWRVTLACQPPESAKVSCSMRRASRRLRKRARARITIRRPLQSYSSTYKCT